LKIKEIIRRKGKAAHWWDAYQICHPK